MRIDDLLADPEWTEERLARAVRRHLPRGARTSASTICRLKRGGRKQRRTASLELALAIERATEGRVGAEDVPLSAASRRMLREMRAALNPAPTESAA